MRLATSLLLALLLAGTAHAQTVTVDPSPSGRRQVIDGFGAFQGSDVREESWWQALFFGDLGASIYRVDLTPRFW